MQLTKHQPSPTLFKSYTEPSKHSNTSNFAPNAQAGDRIDGISWPLVLALCYCKTVKPEPLADGGPIIRCGTPSSSPALAGRFVGSWVTRSILQSEPNIMPWCRPAKLSWGDWVCDNRQTTGKPQRMVGDNDSNLQAALPGSGTLSHLSAGLLPHDHHFHNELGSRFCGRSTLSSILLSAKTRVEPLN